MERRYIQEVPLEDGSGCAVALGLLLLLFIMWSCLNNPFGPGRSRGAQGAAAKTQLANFQTAVELYIADNGRPPTTAQGLDALVHVPKSGPKPKHWVKYISDITEIPNDPWGNHYLYQSPGPNGEAYVITSFGADGKPGGTALDADIVVSSTSIPPVLRSK